MNTTDTDTVRYEGRARIIHRVALLALCAAYVQGSIVKSLDFPGALAEMAHFGLDPPELFAPAVIVFELLASALVIVGIYRWLAALALAAFTLAATFIAMRFWTLPPGMERTMMSYGFFEHIGLTGGFVLVALEDLRCPPGFRFAARPYPAHRSATEPEENSI